MYNFRVLIQNWQSIPPQHTESGIERIQPSRTSATSERSQNSTSVNPVLNHHSNTSVPSVPEPGADPGSDQVNLKNR